MQSQSSYSLLLRHVPLLFSLVLALTSKRQPFVKPLLQSATGTLTEQSANVINNHDQYEVFNDPIAVCRIYIIPRSIYLICCFASLIQRILSCPRITS